MRFTGILLCLAALVVAQPPPRPEHPQPQSVRPAWISLNGSWEFEFDDSNQGIREDWPSGSRKLSKTILVPFCFESKKSGIEDTSFHPVVWYRRSFSVPPEWKGKRTLLNFGAVDYRASVWLNGRFAGEHEGGNTPFRFDVTPLLKSGANVLVVRAWDPPTDRSIPRGKQYWELKPRSIFYTRTSGIWQSVWLEAAGSSYFDTFRIDTTLDGQVAFRAIAAEPVDGLKLNYSIRSGAEVVAEGTGAVNQGKYVSAGAEVRNAKLWSLEHPNLYDVTLKLMRGDQVLDVVETYFGFRKVAIENGRVTLNGRPVYLKFVLDQGYWPESILTPPTDEAIQYDIAMTKEMGFNGARKHQKLEDPRYLYWADKMGFLVSDEMANAYLFDEQYVQRFSREWMEAVVRDRNHPSVIMWAPLNESWGVPNLADPRQREHLRELYHMTKSLDDSRPVIDNEGWQHTETTDLFAVHDYSPSEQTLLARWHDVKVEPGAKLPPNGMQYLAPGQVYNGSPLYLSEFGGIAYIAPGSNVPADSWGYSGIEKTPESAMARMAGIYAAIANSPFIGVCYTQLTDVEQEINGLMTYDRKMKFDPKRLKQINDQLK
jgi:beta-galactosidase/beta-glucuronidase